MWCRIMNNMIIIKWVMEYSLLIVLFILFCLVIPIPTPWREMGGKRIYFESPFQSLIGKIKNKLNNKRKNNDE